MDALKAILTKRDTRSYTDDPVDPAVLDKVLDAARLAGSAKNVQPVRVVTVTDPATKEALKGGGDYATWIDRAPVLVVFTVTTKTWFARCWVSRTTSKRRCWFHSDRRTRWSRPPVSPGLGFRLATMP
jgi:nitroreductase